MNIRRFPFASAINLRELGGYPVGSTGVTRYRQFLRGDGISGLSDREVDILLTYGLKTVIDLRDEQERTVQPNSFFGVEGVSYHTVSLMNTPLISAETVLNFEGYHQMNMYANMVNSLDKMGQVFSIFMNSTSGVTLYHCSAGKDRTGVITALLLMLAGVDRLDIVADYEVSATYLGPKQQLMRAIYPGMPQHLADSDPEWIIHMMNLVDNEYGGIEAYLGKIGVSAEEQAKLRDRLVEPLAWD